MEKRMEMAVTGTLLVIAIGFVIFVDSLVAPPKMLLGRSLTAIEPSLFPLIATAMMILLCLVFLISAYRRTGTEPAADKPQAAEPVDWIRIGIFFCILVFYALTLYPAGFLISTFIAMTALSFLAGNRNVFQIAALSSLCPIGLYIISTRALLVSLPELSSIEFAYAMVLGR